MQSTVCRSAVPVEIPRNPDRVPIGAAVMEDDRRPPVAAPSFRGGGRGDGARTGCDDPCQFGASGIVGQSLALRRVVEQIRQVAATDATVLLLGETGTGKELFASQIHEWSARRGRSMVRVNCGAIPSTLIESELFGREKGAFTGALARQVGRFELADHSTLFLDEIGDLPLEVQIKLLRVLEERVIERLGSPRAIQVETRIVAATHRNLEQRIVEGTFREDLYYRLNVFPICVPPLREREEDVPLLAWRFVAEFSKAFGKRIDAIDEDSMAALRQVLVAGQRPRAAQHRRARDDHDNGTYPHHPAAADDRRRAGAQRETDRRRARAHPQRARKHRVADPWRRRRGRPARAEADDAGDPDGQARIEASASRVGAAARTG